MSIIGAETIGTALLILLGDGVVAAVLLNKSKAQNSGWIVITFGWGFGVMAGAYAVGQFSGAHLNPAVTLGLWVNGNIDGGDVPKYFVGEFLGAFAGAFLVWAAYYVHWAETEDPGLKLSVFCTGPAVRNHAPVNEERSPAPARSQLADRSCMVALPKRCRVKWSIAPAKNTSSPSRALSCLRMLEPLA